MEPDPARRRAVTTQISINVIDDRTHSVSEDDRERAEAAALVVLDRAGTTVAAAYAEFQRQWEWLGTEEAEAAGKCQDYDDLTGLAATWIAAERAADIALTEGWHNPSGASCGISA
jgi:hypothetical protein